MCYNVSICKKFFVNFWCQMRESFVSSNKSVGIIQYQTVMLSVLWLNAISRNNFILLIIKKQFIMILGKSSDICHSCPCRTSHWAYAKSFSFCRKENCPLGPKRWRTRSSCRIHDLSSRVSQCPRRLLSAAIAIARPFSIISYTASRLCPPLKVPRRLRVVPVYARFL